MDFQTTADAAERLHVTVRRIQAMIASGVFPGARRIGRDFLIPVEDVNRELERRQKKKIGRNHNGKVLNGQT